MVFLFSGSPGPVEVSGRSTRFYPLQRFLEENGMRAATWGRPYGGPKRGPALLPPSCGGPMGTSAPTCGRKGDLCPILRAADSRPYGIFAASQSGAPRSSRPTPQHQPHLLGKARRGSGTAPAAIFVNPGPSGPMRASAPTKLRHKSTVRRNRTGPTIAPSSVRPNGQPPSPKGKAVEDQGANYPF